MAAAAAVPESVAMTILVQDLNQWKGSPVLDPADEKIGTLVAVYVDSLTDEWLFGAVEVGFVGFRKVALVPLDQAAAGKGNLRVAHTKDQVKASPTLPQSDELLPADEPLVYAHYGLAYTPADSPSGRRLARR